MLVGLREFQMDKSDIIHKYTADEARSLQAYGELPVSAKINQTAIDMALVGGEGQEEDMGFDFEEVGYSEVLLYFVKLEFEVCANLTCIDLNYFLAWDPSSILSYSSLLRIGVCL